MGGPHKMRETMEQKTPKSMFQFTAFYLTNVVVKVNAPFRHIVAVSAAPQPQFRFMRLPCFCPMSSEQFTTLCS